MSGLLTANYAIVKITNMSIILLLSDDDSSDETHTVSILLDGEESMLNFVDTHCGDDVSVDVSFDV